MLPPLLHCYSLDYLGWQLLDHPFFSIFFRLSTRVSPVSHMASTTILRFLALFRLSSTFPDPILVPVPVIVVPVPISATVLASVPVPNPGVCVVFSTLPDRALTILSNILLCVVANPVRGLLDRKRSEEHLQRSKQSMGKKKKKKKRQKERNNNYSFTDSTEIVLIVYNSLWRCGISSQNGQTQPDIHLYYSYIIYEYSTVPVLTVHQIVSREVL